MASINIPIDDAFLPTAIEKIALYLRYQEEVEDPITGTMIPNPVSKSEFIKRRIYSTLRDMYKAGVKMEADSSNQSTVDQAEIDANAGIGDDQ